MIAANISKWTAGAAIGLVIGTHAPQIWEPGPAVEIHSIEYDAINQIVVLDMFVRRSSTVDWRLTLAESSGVVTQTDGGEALQVRSNRVIPECSQADQADIVRIDEPATWYDRLTDRGVLQETVIPIEEFFPEIAGCQEALEAGELYTASMSIKTASGATTNERVAHIRARSRENEN